MNLAIKANDLVLDTQYLDGDKRILDPLFVYLYVLEVTVDEHGRQTVKLAPAIYRCLDNPPPYDFTLADVAANCKVIRTHYWDFVRDDIRNSDGKLIGFKYTSAPIDGSKEYVIYFKDCTKAPTDGFGLADDNAPSAVNDCISDVLR